MHRGCIIRSFIYIVLVCLFVYILSFSFSLRLFIVIGLQFQFPDFFFFVFSRPSPRDLSQVAQVLGRGRKGIFFRRVRKSRMLYPHPPPRNKASKHPRRRKDKISGFRSGFITPSPSPLFHPLSFLVDVEIFFHRDHPPPPLYRVTRATYRVTKTYIVGKRLDFSQPPSSTTDREEEQASGKRDRVFYIHAHEYRVFHFRSSRGLCVEEGWRMISKG